MPRGTGAPLTVGFTDFPGLIVRFGRWCIQAYPHCGCDACDEDPTALVREFNQRVDSVVRSQFQEQITLSGWLRYGFASSLSGETRLGWREAVSRGAPGKSTWSAWRPKQST